MRMNRLAVTAVAVVAGLSLSACGGDATDTAAPSSPSATSAGTPTQSPTPEEDESAGTTAPDEGPTDEGSRRQESGGTGKTERCHTDDLTIKASDATVGDDPTKAVAVELRNTSDRSCSIRGFAGVNLLSSERAIPAKRRDQKDDGTTLKPGEPTFFGIFYRGNGSGGSGVRIRGLVVTPPDETKSVTLKWPGEPSLPITEDPETTVEIGPMGSIGQGG
ncbi:DUF4232 domain-containing protein [Streptomyces sp. adm13(2018)]|uniref:DUF4232 domain-containing protein n=1 Tax=Streptomyces sp. adm13(2018) TaxID=2479007 RepID=UPI0011CD99A6|nr:DUF4232 domain-containing protein [Streptomyces sp. adm13(2018)]TXS31475.1 DUF4232 domain-containing protein [Streptomyces sp. adm13(2018)]